MRRSSDKTLYIGLSLFSVIIVVSIFAIDYLFNSDQIQKNALDNAIKKTQERELYLKNELSQLDDSLTSLRNSTAFNTYLQSGELTQTLKELMQNTISSHPEFYQLRYLDASGVEKIRFEMDQGKPKLTQELQDKSNRYYYIASLKAPLETIWYSAIDLNMEFGAIEAPLRPTIRAIMPIRHNGSFYGELIINMDMGNILKGLTRAPLYDMIVLNDSGKTITHFDDSKSWSCCIDHPYHIHSEFPSLSLERDLIRTDQFVYRNLSLPIYGGLNLLLQLNHNYLQEAKAQQQHSKLALFFTMLFATLILSLFMVRYIRNKFVTFDHIQALNQRLNNVFNSTDDGIWEWDVSTNEVYFSPKWKSMLGYEDSELTNAFSTWERLLHPDDLKRSQAKAIALANGEIREYETEFRMHTKEGGFLWILSRAKVMEYDEQTQKPTFIVGTHVNIQKIKELNETIALERNKYKALLDNASEAVFIMSPSDGKIVEANQMVCKLLGYEMSDIKHLNVQDWDRAITPEAYQELMKALSSGEPISIERLHTRKDGSTYEASITAVMMKLGGEELVYASVRDVTQEKRHHLEVEQIKDSLKRAQSIAKIGNWELDLITNELYWSDEIYHIFELDTSTFSPSYEAFLDAIHPDDRDMVNEAYTKAVENHTEYQIQHRLLVNGKIKYVEEHAEHLYNEEGKVIKSLGTVQDITTHTLQAQQISTQSQKYSNLINLTYDGVHVLTTKGDMVECSHAFATMLGYTYEEALKLNVRDWDAQIPTDQLPEVIKDLIQNPRKFTTQHRRKDGKVLTVEVNAKGVEIDGEMMLYASAQDRSEILQKEQEFETVFNFSKDGIAILDLASNFVEFNDAYLELTGYSREELYTKSCVGMSIPEDIPRAQEAMRTVREDGFVKNFEKSCYRKDGTLFTINMSGALMPDGEHILISTKDITEEKKNRDRIERLLTEQESLLTLFDKGDSVLFRWNNDEQWSIDYVSNNVENLLGYTKAEFFESVTYSSLIHPDDIEHVMQEVQEGSQSSENFFRHDPYRITTKSGELKWVLDYTVLVKDEQNQITHYLGYIIDFTDYVQQEQSLNEADERFALAIEGTKDGLWDWNLLTNEVYFSPNWKRMLGYEIDEIEDKLTSWSDNVHPDDIEHAYANVNAHLDGTTEYYEDEQRMKHKDGHWIWILDRGKALFDEEGKPYRFIGFHTDITHRKELEAELKLLNEDLQSQVQQKLSELRDKEQMLVQQSKLASMGEMIGAIAHQWRQPLNVISTGIQNLKYDYEDGLITEEFLDKFITKNKKTINFMSKTIDDFRSFFRVDKDKRDFDLQEMVKSVLDMQSAQLKSHEIEVVIEGESRVVHSIQSELQQVILNLINNAKDALIEQSIPYPKITITITPQSIDIHDNAKGIPEAIIDRIFEPYFTTKDEGKGTGMGLYMSKMIIEQNLGGTLSVSNDNEGATFRINLT
jgi:PAS domain S-box-containing protein